VANHLDYSSPQSFGRHVRTVLRITAGEFRCTYDGGRMLDRFRRELIQPNLERLRELHPLAVRHGMRLLPLPRPFAASLKPALRLTRHTG
jgi:hypothetical protein